MKLIIQIPCYNEAETLPQTLAVLPKQVPGFDVVEWLVVDDGSADKTSDVARAHGVHHVVRHPRNRGLARTFMTGLDSCLKRGADVVVNTDADNQYDARDIVKLVEPILRDGAEFVIGERPIGTIDHFSPIKKTLQKVGTAVVRRVSKTPVRDAPSGFRAFNRKAAMRMNVFSEYTYTLETLIQAGVKGLKVVSVPVRVNGKTRESRLVRSSFDYVRRSAITIIRIQMIYQPAKFFFRLGLVPFTLGALLCLRWLWLFAGGTTRTHLPSLVAAAVFVLMGLLLWICGLLAELIATNRKALEDIQERIRELDVRGS